MEIDDLDLTKKEKEDKIGTGHQSQNLDKKNEPEKFHVTVNFKNHQQKKYVLNKLAFENFFNSFRGKIKSTYSESKILNLARDSFSELFKYCADNFLKYSFNENETK